jgi:hypothetical protein
MVVDEPETSGSKRVIPLTLSSKNSKAKPKKLKQATLLSGAFAKRLKRVSDEGGDSSEVSEDKSYHLEPDSS